VVHGEAKPFPGHPNNPFTDDDLAGKLAENVEPFAGPEQTARLARHLDAIGTRPVRDLTALLALVETSGVDAAKTE
jgi:2-methylcitrate dehydratase